MAANLQNSNFWQFFMAERVLASSADFKRIPWCRSRSMRYRAYVLFATLFIGSCCTASQVVPSAVDREKEDERISAFFESVFQRWLDRSPTFQTYLGIKTDYGTWDDFSDEHEQEDYALALEDLKTLRTFDGAKLSDPQRLSYRLLEYDLQMSIEGFTWRFHNYPVSQMRGWHSHGPAFMINFHRVDDLADAKAYISRLRGMGHLLAQVEQRLRDRQAMGILAPKFVFPMAIDDCTNVISGRPFTEGSEDSPLLADFRRKVEGLKSLSTETQTLLLAEAQDALLQTVAPAYQSLIALLREQEQIATTDDGAWKFPDGEAFYNFALRRTTTTQLTSEEIHSLGSSEVARIHGEMRAIMTRVGFEGELQDFFEFTRKDPQFYHSNDAAGRDAYLKKVDTIISHMKGRLDELFVTKPKADLLVKAVEPYREKSAGKAFYSAPAPDGSRPGIYYANLYDMASMPIYQMEALAYHEAIPGHHMQIAIAQELEALPRFRRFGGYTAYAEGWGLYSELIPKEMGLYADPYSDFGRLAMELWRACRLVVDTGIHAKRWTREQAIRYLRENTPNSHRDIVKAIERYIVMPSQATAYKVGMLEILKLREQARGSLGDRFDLRAFHDLVLTGGSVPLEVLGERVEAWIEGSKS